MVRIPTQGLSSHSLFSVYAYNPELGILDSLPHGALEQATDSRSGSGPRVPDVTNFLLQQQLLPFWRNNTAPILLLFWRTFRVSFSERRISENFPASSVFLFHKKIRRLELAVSQKHVLTPTR